MSRQRPPTALIVLLSTGLWIQATALPAMAEPKMSKQIEIQADQKTVKEILAAFGRAEAAMKAQNLETLMALYSKDYNYHGLKKNDLRETWKDLFARYQRIASHHIFSKVVVMADDKTPKAQITCTGGLWATSETTGERIIIDSWFEEVHRLVYEDGSWRILGHAGEHPQSLPMGGAHPYF